MQHSDIRSDAEPPVITTEFAFTAQVHVGEPLTVDDIPGGVRRYIPITGGSVAGPRLNGTVLAAGGIRR